MESIPRKIFLLLLIIFTVRLELYSEMKPADLIFSELTSSNSSKINHAYEHIQRHRPEDLVSRIVNIILSGEKYNIKKIMLKALNLYPKRNLIPVWLRILKNSKSLKVKRDVIQYLSDYYDRRLVAPLTKELRNPYNIVRESAAKTLKKVGDDRMYPIILEMADSSNPVFRIYFIEAMNFLYDMRFHVSLLKLINDQNKSVRIYAINCIEKNRIIDALHLLRNRALTDENDEVKIAAIKTLGNFMDSKSLYVLLRTVSDNNREIRFATVKALYAIGSRKSAQSLSLLLLREEDDAIKGLILDTLIKLRSYGDIRALEKILLKDENFRLRVKSAYFFGYTRDNYRMVYRQDDID